MVLSEEEERRNLDLVEISVASPPSLGLAIPGEKETEYTDAL